MTAANDSDTLAQRLEVVRRRIANAVQQYQRAPQSVTLLAASKGQPAAALRVAHHLGVIDFGENYLSEALAKQAELSDLSPLRWHFIGPVQSNKTRDIAAAFDWVHSVDRAKLLRRLSEQRPAGLAPLQVCLQVNLASEAQKSGCDITELAQLAKLAVSLPRLTLRGLMTIPPQQGDPAPLFRQLDEMLAQLRNQLPTAGLDTLSMGMSDDLETAVACGSTIVRVGSALFGPRLKT